MDETFRRLSYVRYADDFLIGVVGTHRDTEGILEKVTTFLNSLGLEMNKKKTKITNARKSAAHFLGTNIFWNRNKEKKVVLRRRTGKHKRKKVRVSALVGQTAPIRKLVKKLVERKLFKWRPDGHMASYTGLTRMINFDHADILKYFNAVVRGIMNYYSFVDNKSKLCKIIDYLKYSCRLT